MYGILAGSSTRITVVDAFKQILRSYKELADMWESPLQTNACCALGAVYNQVVQPTVDGFPSYYMGEWEGRLTDVGEFDDLTEFLRANTPLAEPQAKTQARSLEAEYNKPKDSGGPLNLARDLNRMLGATLCAIRNDHLGKEDCEGNKLPQVNPAGGSRQGTSKRKLLKQKLWRKTSKRFRRKKANSSRSRSLT